MEKTMPVSTLKWQMVGTVLLCWLVPVALVLAVMGWYISSTLSQRSMDNLTEQLRVNTQLCADRLDGALSASRVASMDPTIKTAWANYDKDGLYPLLYQSCQEFLVRQYRYDSRFRFAVFWFWEDAERMRLSVVNQTQGAVYRQISTFWTEDAPAVTALAAELDTRMRFVSFRDELYLVRNVVDTRFQPIGTLVLSLTPDYYFDHLSTLPWANEAALFLEDLVLPAGGAPLPTPAHLADRHPGFRWNAPADNLVSVSISNREYALGATARLDTHALLGQFRGYLYILAGLLALILPLLLYVLHFFQRRVSQPVQALMDGAKEIEEGNLGHQVAQTARSREFQYLTASFNHMSGQLRYQFERLYQEELALRDARIKALQSQINPHFLNNTLEIINWEARMAGNTDVSRMIEALSTLLDAAMARDHRPEIRLSEEMQYVNSYFYIVSQRFGKRLTVDIQVADDVLECPVPRLILQPVIENAVEHGIAPGQRGTITIRGYRKSNLLLLEVGNDGGLSPEDEAHIRRLLAPNCDTSRESSRNIGISNVNQRLWMLYGLPSGLCIQKMDEKHVVARLTSALDGREDRPLPPAGDASSNQVQ